LKGGAMEILDSVILPKRVGLLGDLGVGRAEVRECGGGVDLGGKRDR